MSKKEPLEEGLSLSTNEHKWRIYTSKTGSHWEFLPPGKLTIHLIFYFSLGAPDATHVLNITIPHQESHAPET